MISRRFVFGATCAAVLFSFPPGARAVIDQNGNGISDIWEMVYGASGLNPFADDDGDGFTNYQEAIAGTNPRDPNSKPPVPQLAIANGAITVSWNSVAGKAYRVQTSDTVDAAALWTNLGGPLLGDGTVLSATFGVASGAKKFFRITVSDMDSDGDGVTDWEERALGFDPYRPDTFNTGLGDKQVILNALASANTITVAVVDGVASKSPLDTATLRFTRAGNLNAVTSAYAVTGTAVSGTDFLPLAGSVSFPLGKNSVDLVVQVAPGATLATAKTVIVTLTTGSGYTIGSPASATVNLSPTPAAGQVIQEIWNGVTGYSDLADIPFTAPPTSARLLSTLEIPLNAGDDYGTRVRGYITAPTTGNYTFWVAGDDVAYFYLATDDQPANATLRSYTDSYTNSREWGKYPTQKSALIALTAGARYYFELQHREYTGGDNAAVGWLKPGQSGTVPSEVVPTGVLSPYIAPATPTGLSTLYFGALLPQAGAPPAAAGFATVRLAQDQSVAIVNLSRAGLSGAPTSLSLRGPAGFGQTGPVIAEFAAATPQADGTFVWTVGSPAAIAALKSGLVYALVATAANPSGELRAQLLLNAGAGTFTPPPPPPTLPNTPPTANEAARFLVQATFGPTNQAISDVQRDGYAAWVEQQLNLPPTFTLPILEALATSGQNIGIDAFQEAWWKNVVNAPDQLRQRVVFALSQIMVISDNDGTLGNEPFALASYYDVLGKNALGNYRQLLEDVTLSVGMGIYLDMLGNDKPNPVTGAQPNENYGREVMQLFSIGLQKLNPDGSLRLDNASQPINTYGQTEVIGMAHVFTGWNFAQNPPYGWDYLSANYRQPMTLVPGHHDTGAKRVLDGVVLPANQTGEQDLKDAHDMLANHANTGPFIARQLIQKLVTGNPTPAYVYRVAQVFANNGQGVRGDLKAVIRAVLLDYEARTATNIPNVNFGRQRDPIARLATVYRAFNGRAYNNRYQISIYDVGRDFAQAALDAPSVFNFYSPFFARSGEIASAGLVSPEFQITNETTAITSSNNLRDKITNVVSAAAPTEVGLDLSAPAALAGNPATLVDSLNTLLLSGQMSSGLRTQVINAVTSVAASNPLGRAQTAVQTIATSPEFCVQK